MWITRDIDDSLVINDEIPTKFEEYWENIHSYNSMVVPDCTKWKDVKWEDEKPTKLNNALEIVK